MTLGVAARYTPETQILPNPPVTANLNDLWVWAQDMTRTLQQNLGGIARKANDQTFTPTADLDMGGFNITNAGNISAVTFTYGGHDVLYNSGPLGTPASGLATNLTGLPVSTGIAGLGTGVATFLATPSSANLRGALTDETGTGPAYFAGGDLGTPSAGVATNLTGLSLTTGVTGTLGAGNGGTAITSYTAGDMLYATGSTTLAKLAKGTANQTLQMNAGATAPNWITVAGAAGVLVGLQTFSASGTYTPTTGAGSALAIVTGGGGGGGNGSNVTSAGSGGGAGGTTLAFISSPGTLTVTIGGGGAANTNGVASSLGTITANGGTHGTGSGLGGAGGAATATGTIGIAGGDGGSGSVIANPNDQAGEGGSSFWGGGGTGGVNTSSPRAGVAFGSGGGGGSSSTGGTTGGAGAGGLVVVMEFK